LEKNDEGILGVSASKMEGWYEKLAFFHQYVAFFSKLVQNTAIVTTEDE